jgi:hypothetical protein
MWREASTRQDILLPEIHYFLRELKGSTKAPSTWERRPGKCFQGQLADGREEKNVTYSAEVAKGELEYTQSACCF